MCGTCFELDPKSTSDYVYYVAKVNLPEVLHADIYCSQNRSHALAIR